MNTTRRSFIAAGQAVSQDGLPRDLSRRPGQVLNGPGVVGLLAQEARS